MQDAKAMAIDMKHPEARTATQLLTMLPTVVPYWRLARKKVQEVEHSTPWIRLIWQTLPRAVGTSSSISGAPTQGTARQHESNGLFVYT